MALSQFHHQEAFSLIAKKGKRSAEQIANEAMRVKGYCNHVKVPEEPEILFGVDPRELVKDFKMNAKHLIDRGNKKLRKDALWVVGGVISSGKREASKEWIEDTIDLLKQEFGSSLKAIIRHKSDESFDHIHYYLVPEYEKGKPFSIDQVHVGLRAKNECKGNARQKDIVYKRAMQKLNERFYQSVSIKHGYALKSVRRERIQNRNEYFQYKRQLTSIEKENQRLKAKAYSLKDKNADLRIDNMYLVNDKHFFEQDKAKISDLAKETEIRNQEVIKRENKLVVEEKNSSNLANKLKRFIQEITENPNDFKNRIIFKLNKEREKLMNVLNEKLRLTNELEKELAKQVELNNLETEHFFKKLKQIEIERQEHNRLKSKFAKRVAGFSKCKKEALKHLYKGRVNEAMVALYEEGKQSESSGYMGFEAKTGHELSK